MLPSRCRMRYSISSQSVRPARWLRESSRNSSRSSGTTRLSQAAREFGAVHVDGFRALVARGDIEAVLIFSPQWFGPLPILASSEAGKAVYCASRLDLPSE